ARAGLPRLLTPRVHLASPVAVVAGVSGVRQDARDRVAGRRPPLQLPPIRSGVRTDADANTMSEEVTEDLADPSQTLELVEDQAHDGLDLRVGVDGKLPRRQLDVADPRQGEKLASSRLVALALVHSAAQNVQLRGAHNPLNPQQ